MSALRPHYEEQELYQRNPEDITRELLPRAATPAMFAALRATHRSPLAALRAYGDCMAAMGESLLARALYREGTAGEWVREISMRS